jgi:hypothetical protein
MNAAALRAVALFACLSLQTGPTLATGGSTAYPGVPPRPFTEDDLALLQTDADGVALTDTLGGYSSRAGLYLPVGELARLLDLAIYVDPMERKATGWVVDETRIFNIDLVRNIARGEGQEFSLQLGDAVVQSDEIYIRAEILQRLLPITFVADMGDMALHLRTREKLPFKARMERESRKPFAEASFTDQVEGLEQPYRILSIPSFDLTLSVEAGNHAPVSGYNYDLRLGGDLLYTGFQLFAASDAQGTLDNMRVLFERKDPSGRGMAGPLGITRANFGDTIAPGLSIGPQSSAGRGLFLTSESLEQANIFDRTDLRGELPLGYQVELYVNEVLRGSEMNTQDGRYAFTEIPLVYGSNLIRLVFYGPRGERREEVRRINVDGNQLAAGSTSFSAGLIEEGRQMIEINKVPEAARLFLPGYGQLRAVARIAHGLGNGVTVNGGLAHFAPLSGNGRTLLSAGMLANLNGYSTQVDGAWDSSGAQAMALGLAGRPAGISFVARHSEYRGRFFDESQPLGALAENPLRRSTALRSDFVLGAGGQTVPIALTISREETADKRRYLKGSVRSSRPVGRYLLSTGIDAQQESGGGQPSQRRIGGATEVTGLVALGWQLRAGSSYELLPKAKLISATFTADRRLSERFSLRLAAARYFGEGQTTAFQGGLTRQFRFANITLNSSYVTTNKDLRVGLQLSIGGLFDPIKRRYRLTPPGSGAGGNIAVQAFEDVNGNGLRDPLEAPVPDLKIMSAGKEATTDADGQALAQGLGSGPKAILEVDPDSMKDPYLQLAKARWQFIPRPGRVAVANLAFVRAGEVTILAEFDSGAGKYRGLSALALQLLDAKGKVAFEGRSEFDGSLLAEGLAPGSYRVALDPEQASRLGIMLEDNPLVTISDGGGYVGQFKVRVARTSPKKDN